MKSTGLIRIIREQTNLILTHSDDYAMVTTKAPLKIKKTVEPKPVKQQVKVALT